METESDAEYGIVLEQWSSIVGHTVTVTDGMAELQAFNKHQTDTCNNLFIQFSNKLFTKYKGYSQLHIVFDTYTQHSLRSATRAIRQHNTVAKEFKTDKRTNIKSVPLNTLLSHVRTKDASTELCDNSILQLQQSSNWMLLLLIVTKFNRLNLYFIICLVAYT